MSNSLAIAATTATLQSILQQNVVLESDLSDTTVTILPLDKARGTNTNNQLNLFLYMVARNAAFVNSDMPPQVQPGELGISPLPINLYFLLTAFGRDDDATQPFGHELLGKGMSILYDHPILSAADIQGATQSLLPENDLANQIERIRITFHPLSIDELSKLWTGFAMQYRLSAAYEISVLLIASTRAASAPLPVLMRGPQDSGVTSQADLMPPLPTLVSISPPNQQPGARLNDVVTLSGFNLNGPAVQVEFLHPLWTDPVLVAPEPGGNATSLAVQIPNQPSAWPAGFYNVAVVVTRPGETFSRTTNQLSLAVAPAITITPASAPAGTIIYTVMVTPDVWPTQSATLIIGDDEFTPTAFSSSTSTLTFSTTGLAGSYWVRLRVDGVDSLLVNRSTTPPTFDPTQQVTVT